MSDNSDQGIDSISYHCFVKVCPSSEFATCSKTDLTNTANTCVAPSYFSLAGRKRRENDLKLLRQSATDGSTIAEVIKYVAIQSVSPKNCRTIVNGACIVQKDENLHSSTTIVRPFTFYAFLAVISFLS